MAKLIDIASGIRLLLLSAAPIQARYEVLIKDWSPDMPPITLIFSAIGREFSSVNGQLSNAEHSSFWNAVEDLMVNGDEDVKNGVATGLIEAVLSEVTLGRLAARRFVDHLGPATKAYCRSWDEFTGCMTEGI
jgi:hypothetical protein